MVLPKVVQRRAKRLGRGFGSGKGGHTSGRGQKGQKSRGHSGIMFEGVKVKKSLLKKLHLMGGKAREEALLVPIVKEDANMGLVLLSVDRAVELLIKEG